MKNIMSVVAIILLLSMVGCSGKFWAGAGGGALGAGAGYELNLERQMDRIEDDLADGKIDQQEFDIRKNQIERDSLLK